MTVAAQTERTRSLEPGARIGRKLEVLRRLGEGGMGTLWVARNLTTEAEVAIKVLRTQHEDNSGEDTAERFRHEARLGAMLAHRHITRVFDLLEDDDGSLVLVMELLHGQTLEEAYLAKGPLPGSEAVAIVVPVLRALQHAHDHNVVHRDVKPSNIFLHVDPDGHATPKLLDFGIAKMPDSSVKTRAGDVLGTPSYMSPEQVRASKKLDGRSDLFSVGALLYEIITGENPFRTDSPSATLARVLELEVDPDPRIEPRLWLEIQRALSKQAYERHASAGKFADALCDAVGGMPSASVSVRRINADPQSEEPTAPPAAVVRSTTEVVGEVTAAAALPTPLPVAKLVVYGTAVLLALGGLLFLLAARSQPSQPTATTTTESPSTTAPSSATAPPSPSDQASWEIPDESSATNPQRPSRTPAPRRTPPRRPAVSSQTPGKPPPSASTAPPVARTPGF